MEEQAQAAPAAPEAPEAPATTQAEASPPDDVQLQPIEKSYDLLSDKQPEWMAALQGVLETDDKKSFSVPKETIDGLPIEAKQLLHNMRSKMLQSTQDTSGKRKEYETGLTEVDTMKRELEAERVKLYDMFRDPRLKEMMTAPEGNQPDPFTKEGQAWLAKKHFAEYFSSFTNTINEMTEESRQSIAEQEVKLKTQNRFNEIDKFSKENPDFKDHFAEIKAMVDKYNLPAEQAYNYVKLDKGLMKDDLADARAQSQMASSRGTASRPLLNQKPNSKDARDIADFYQQNPDVMKADLERFRRMGTEY